MIKSKTLYLVGLGAGLIALSLLFIAPQSTFAAVGSGSGGSGGGGGPGTPQTGNGHGWYRFTLSEQGPANIMGSSLSWAQVRSICSAENATHILAYLVFRPTGGVTNAAVYGGYYPENWQNFRGNNGGQWRNAAYARGVFNNLPASQRAGYRIAEGTGAVSSTGPGRGNVGWLCDGQAFNFTTTGTSTVNRTTAYPGETITWTHTLRNNGPTASSSIRSQTVNSGFSNASFNGTRNITTATMNANTNRSHGSYAVYTATNADIGRTLCQQLQWDPTNSSGGRNGRAVNRCVNVIPRPWTTSATTTRSVNGTNQSATNVSVSPGQIVRWTHTLTLNNNQNHLAIRSQTSSTGFSNGWNGIANVANTAAWRPVGNIRTINPSVANRTQHTITQADVGNTLCQQLQWDPTNSSGGRDGRSSNLCVNVPFSYNLVPTITGGTDFNPGSAESDTRTYTVRGQVTNEGDTKSRPNVNWQLTEIRWNPGVTPGAPHSSPETNSGIGSANPCAYFTGESSCTSLRSGTEAEGYGGPGTIGPGNPERTRQYDGNASRNNEAIGTKICYVMSVQPYNHSTNNWHHSRLYCIIISKSPKVQVLGGSIQTGRVFSGTTSDSNGDVVAGTVTKMSDGLTYGSWAEYGILASGEVRRFSSGSGLNSGANGGHSSTAQTAWSPYTFTRSSSNTYGNYSSGGAALPDPTIVFPQPSTSVMWNANLSAIAKDRVVRPPVGTTNVVLTANPGVTFAANRWLVINAIGHNVTIANDIRYADGPFNEASQIPQLIIIANNITINSNVEHVDAWLVAKNGSGTAYGAISTCNQQSSGTGTAQWLASGTNYTSSNANLSIEHCNRQLRINGSVIASKLYLRRTAGSEPNNGAAIPAEIINLRPDAYLWAKEHMSPALIYQTVTETELPPRY